MSGGNKDVRFPLHAVVNKEKNELLYALIDNDFADILLSFLTLPLGRIVQGLDKRYGDEAATIGSLSSLYHSLANLDCARFRTEGAKQILLNPTSSFEDEIKELKLDISDSPPAEYFYCTNKAHNRFRSVSTYYDQLRYCRSCRSNVMSKQVIVETTRSGNGVFASPIAAFTISHDLQILPNKIGLIDIHTIFDIRHYNKAKTIQVDFGFNEIMDLLKASLTSPTPLSDLILNKTRSATVEMECSQPKISLHEIDVEEKRPNSGSKDLSLKVVIQKSTGKLLYSQAKEDFVEFLFSFLTIPLGGVEHLLAGKTCVKAIYSLYQSTAEYMENKYFKSKDMKKRLMKPNVVHGCISKDHILPLTEEPLPVAYRGKLAWFSSVKFPKGQGSYLKGPRTYKVTDDLTVTPFCIASVISSLSEQNIPISDVEEVKLQIGLKEAWSILKASLTSTSALTDALLTHASNKRIKREV